MGRGTLHALLLSFTAILAGCGADSENDVPLVDLKLIEASEVCEFGGSEIRTGIDSNSNGALDETEVISTTVTCDPQPDNAVSSMALSFEGNEDEPLTGQLLATGQAENITYHLSLNSFKGVIQLNEDGSFIYTPHENVTGSDVFTYFLMIDGQPSNTSVVEIQISELNDAPTAQESHLYAYNTSAVNTQLVAEDADSQDLVFTLIDSPAFGSALISESGLLDYTANEGYLGTDQLTFSVSDGEFQSTALVNINVTNTVLQIISESPAQYSVEKGVLEQQRTTLSNLGDEFVLVWTVDFPEWYSRVSDVIAIAGRSSIEVAFDLDARQLDEGSYQGNVVYTSAEPGMPTISQSLLLEVTEDLTPPAIVSDLSLDGIAEFDQANLRWTAVADSGRRGLPVSNYEIRYSTTTITEGNWSAATALELTQAPALPETTEEVLVTSLLMDTTYYFAIKSTDRINQVSGLSNILSFTTPTPPVPELADSAISIREAEQATVDIVLNNTGQSPLRYSASLTVNGLSEPAQLQAATVNKSLASTKLRELSSLSVANNNGDIIIKLNSAQQNTRSFSDVLNQYNLQETKSFDALGIKVVRPENQNDVVTIINELNSLESVAYAEPDYSVQALYLPNDTFVSEQWAVNNEGQTGGSFDADIDAVESWDRYKNGSNVVVAVIDTGVKYDHEDLVDNIWVNPNEIAGNGIDDDNNGYIDDIHGYDFVNSDGDPMDDNDHGTHCSGILGAKGDNNLGIVGAAHTANIMGVKFLSAGGSGNTSDAIDAVLYAVDNGAKILSNSWGGGAFSQALFDAISYANDHDVLFIAAAGNNSSNNDSSPSYPANYDLPNVISVASSDHNDQRSGFSNYGLSVDLAAPGTDILSSTSDGGYQEFSGTSMATPYVSGAAILIRSNFPELSALETKDILLSTVDVLDQWEGLVATGGRLNISSALQEASKSAYIAITENAEGEVAPGESVVIQLEIDATDKLAGLYEHQLVLTTNAPGFETLTSDVDVTVEFDAQAPNAIEDLMILEVTPASINLQWSNVGDDGDTGQASALTFAYSTIEITADNWSDATLIDGPTPTLSGEAQSFTISNLLPETSYYVAMKSIDNSGQSSSISNVEFITTPLGSVVSVTPESIAEVSLNQGESSVVSLSIGNDGDETLDYTINLVDTLEDAQPTQQYESMAHEKGEEDTRIGSVSPQGSGGPDEYGYQWRDSDEGSVNYDWTDISSTGTSISFGDDSVSASIDLGFTFNFYGVDYTQVYVTSNGFLSFSSTSSGCCSGQPLPSVDSYKNLIAWAWKDLHPRGGTTHYLTNGDDFIVQFTDYGEYSGSGYVTAQVIISSNGKIKIQYNNFTSSFTKTNVSVGIENSDSTDGLQVVFNSSYLKDALAIEFSTAIDWASLSQSFGSVLSGASADDIDLTFDTSDLDVGSYQGYVVVESNDAANPQVSLPISLEVLAAP